MLEMEILMETEVLVKKEKSYTVKILKNLQIIKERRYFARLGYSSLFTYLTHKLKYTESEAYLRLNTLKLMNRSKDITQALQDGDLSLTHTCKLEGHIDKEEKLRKRKFTKTETDNLVNKAKSLTTRDLEIELNKQSVAPKDRTITIRVKESTYKKFRELTCDNKSLSDDILLNAIMEERENYKNVSKRCIKKIKKHKRENGEKKSKAHTRHIQQEVKDELLVRSSHRCEFHGDEGRCTQRRNLEYDHFLKNYAQGGENTVENLRVVCKSHNQYKSILDYGWEKMKVYYGLEPQ